MTSNCYTRERCIQLSYEGMAANYNGPHHFV